MSFPANNETLARMLGGEAYLRGAIVPGPGHSSSDRSLSVTLSPCNPDGFVCFSHAGDDFAACRDHVKKLLGDWTPKAAKAAKQRTANGRAIDPDEIIRQQALARALEIWTVAQPIAGTPAEQRLIARGLFIDADAARSLRYHASCPFKGGERHPCMIAVLRDVANSTTVGIHRTRLDAGEGVRAPRRIMGRLSDAAIMLSPAEYVHTALTICEGVETGIACIAYGFGPVWAAASSAMIAKFGVRPGITTLRVMVEADESGARAAAEVAERWRAAGRRVLLTRPKQQQIRSCPDPETAPAPAPANDANNVLLARIGRNNGRAENGL